MSRVWAGEQESSNSEVSHKEDLGVTSLQKSIGKFDNIKPCFRIANKKTQDLHISRGKLINHNLTIKPL